MSLLDDSKYSAFSEAILRAAVIENHDREMSEIPSNVELSKLYALSKHHDERMNMLFVKEAKKEVRHKVFLFCRKVAAVFVISFTMLFGLLMISPEVRATVRQTIIEWYEQFTRFSFTQSETINESTEWIPAYLPDGFFISDAYTLVSAKIIEYSNDSGLKILFEYSPEEEVSFGVDNEHATYSVITDNGVEYHTYKSDNVDYPSHIIWNNKGFSFHLESSMSADILEKIVTSVTPKK